MLRFRTYASCCGEKKCCGEPRDTSRADVTRARLATREDAHYPAFVYPYDEIPPLLKSSPSLPRASTRSWKREHSEFLRATGPTGPLTLRRFFRRGGNDDDDDNEEPRGAERERETRKNAQKLRVCGGKEDLRVCVSRRKRVRK